MGEGIWMDASPASHLAACILNLRKEGFFFFSLESMGGRERYHIRFVIALSLPFTEGAFCYHIGTNSCTVIFPQLS